MSDRIRPRIRITFNPIEGQFDLITDNNFSYESVPENRVLTIEQNMQMIVVDGFDVEGELRLEGNLVVEV